MACSPAVCSISISYLAYIDFIFNLTELENHLKETKYELRTGGYTGGHNGSAFSLSMNYPKMEFANTGPSGETLYEFRKAQNALNGGSGDSFVNGGVVNSAFVGSDMYLHAQHSDETEATTSSEQRSEQRKGSPRRESSSPRQSNNSDVDPYKPPSSSYGLSSNSSFKRVDNPHIKKQPRTQLAVPPCRPELPPRDSAQPKLNSRSQNSYADTEVPLSEPKHRTRNGGKSTTKSPPRYDYNQDVPVENLPPYREPLGNFQINGYGLDSKHSQVDAVKLNGSIEKISRV